MVSRKRTGRASVECDDDGRGRTMNIAPGPE